MLPEAEQQYSDAVSLYNKYGKNQNLKRLFSRNQVSNYAKQKVIYELQQIVKTLPAERIQAALTAGKEAPVVDLSADQHQAPPHIERSAAIVPPPNHNTQETVNGDAAFWKQKRARLINQRAILSNSLHDFAENDNNGRAIVMQQISLLDKGILECTNALIALDSGAAIVVEKESTVIKPILEWTPNTSPIELIKQRNALRVKISKLKKNDRDTVEEQNEIVKKIKIITKILEGNINERNACGDNKAE